MVQDLLVDLHELNEREDLACFKVFTLAIGTSWPLTALAVIFIFIISKYLENHLFQKVSAALKKLIANGIGEWGFIIFNHDYAFLEGIEHLFGFFLHFFDTS